MVARIAGVTLPAQKRVEVALRSIYGIGPTLARKILEQTGVDPSVRAKDLSDADVGKLRDAIEKRYKVEGELKRDILMNVKRLKEIGAYRGVRHSKRLPVRGQRTRTNSRTIRGNVRRTMGSGKRPAAEKT